MVFDPTIYLPVVSSTNLGVDCDDCSDDPREELTFTPELLYFDYMMPNGVSDPQPFTVTNTGTLPVGLASFTISGDFQMLGVVPENLLPGESFTLTATFTPTEDGARLGEIIVDAGTSDPLARVKLIGIGGNSAIQAAIIAMQLQMTSVLAQLALANAHIDSLQDTIDSFELGQVRYTWRAYAKSSDGSVDFTTGTPTPQHGYLGLAFNKSTIVPSQDFEDYSWSSINAIESNFIAQDTINVNGIPAWQLVNDLAALSYQIMAYQFDRQTLLDYVNAGLTIEGVPVTTVISNEQLQRIEGDEALAGTISLIGARNLAGTAFILDMDTTFVSADMSLSTRLSAISAEAGDASAQVQNLTEAIAEANYASAVDLALLGAKTLDGTAFVLDMDLVQVGPDQTLAQYVNTAVAAAAGEAASVTELYEALVTPTGGAVAKALLQLDVNGHIVNTVATNDGDIGSITFNFDSFNIVHPGSLDPVFSVSGGVVRMSNVEIDTLVVGSVTSEALAEGAIQRVHFAKTAAVTVCPKNVWKSIFTITFDKEDADSLLEAVMYGVFQTTDDLIYDAHFLIDGVTQTPTQRVNLVLGGHGPMNGFDDGAGGSSPMTPWAFIENLDDGAHTIEFRVMNKEPDSYSGNGNMNILTGACMKITELKKGAV